MSEVDPYFFPNRKKVESSREQRLVLTFLRSPWIISKEAIPPDYVALRAGTATLFLLGT